MQRWTLYGENYEESGDSSCICGKKNIKHLNFLCHTVTGNMIIVGSECIKQFGVSTRDVELMNLEERGLSVEFVMRDDEVLIFRVIRIGNGRTETWANFFPGFMENTFIAVEDRDNVLEADDQVAQTTTGQLCLKPADPANNSSNFLIVSFDRKDFRRDEIKISGKVWAMSPPPGPHIAEFEGTCPVCKADFIVGKTSIIPCLRADRRKKWICAWHWDRE